MAAHVVKKASEFTFSPPGEFSGKSTGYTTRSIVDESNGGVQMGFRLGRLDSSGGVVTHLHSFEESIFVMEGSLVVDNVEGSFRMEMGDYCLFPTGTPHALRNLSDQPVEFAEMRAPLPRERVGYDTYFAPPLAESVPESIDVRDPRTRLFGHIDPANMDPTLQTQDRLALSASMRTALLVYSGISVKMMIDSDLGADLSTMFMVQYEPGGFAGAHDHPLEEAYLILEGQVDAGFDGAHYELGPGDVAWAGVGCVHEFRNIGAGPVRWLETQAPQPPARYSYRFDRDWSYLQSVLGEESGPGP